MERARKMGQTGGDKISTCFIEKEKTRSIEETENSTPNGNKAERWMRTGQFAAMDGENGVLWQTKEVDSIDGKRLSKKYGIALDKDSIEVYDVKKLSHRDLEKMTPEGEQVKVIDPNSNMDPLVEQDDAESPDCTDKEMAIQVRSEEQEQSSTEENADCSSEGPVFPPGFEPVRPHNMSSDVGLGCTVEKERT